jgi:hypothetical protein
MYARSILHKEITMSNEPENPQPGHRPDPERPMPPGQEPQDPTGPRRDDDIGRKHGHRGADDDKVGQDTDGDGKVVKPGQKPGQSGGKGLPENR